MAWQAIYEGDAAAPQVFTDQDTPDKNLLPGDGLQAVVIDGTVRIGFEAVAFLADGGIAVSLAETPEELQVRFPAARVVRARTTDTSRFHTIEVGLGLWLPENSKPDAADPAWHKQIIGWRLWTSNKVFDSSGVAEADWLTHWASLPATDIQVVMCYENWATKAGVQYTQIHGGGDRFFMAAGPEGWIIHTSMETALSIEGRYSGPALKEGRAIADNRFQAIVTEALASTMP